jgi:choline dehydrogenase-like flavoprotein
MAYWADHDRSVYRPQWTLDELRRSPRFTYQGGRFVQSFSELGGRVRVRAQRLEDGAPEEHEAAALVLAAGTIGTAWIVLRSLGRYDQPVPILCNPYAYVPMLNFGTLGRPVRDRRHSLAQLTCMLRGAGGRTVQAQVFSYRSLLTFKLMKESPLAHRETLRAMRLLIPHFSILGIHHEDRPTSAKRLLLRRGGAAEPDRLRIDYAPAQDELLAQRSDERALRRIFRRLGCLPLSTIRPGHGANIHYAGTFPMDPRGGELSCDSAGRLRATRAVHLADGSVFPWLPAKGLTFTLMAHANRVGALLAKRLG